MAGWFLTSLIVTYAYICFSARSTAAHAFTASPLGRMLPYQMTTIVASP